MTEFGYDPRDDEPAALPPATVEGSGTGNHLPRVTIKLTARQLRLLRLATDWQAGTDEPDAHEFEAMRDAFDALLDIPNGPHSDAVYDISLAPEVDPKW